MIKLIDIDRQDADLKPLIRVKLEQILLSDKYILGPDLDEFEYNFARELKVNHVIGCASGTDALTLSLRALGIGQGDEVITVPNTFIATVEAIINVGATPVFCDVDPDTMLMDVSLIPSRITTRTRAILPVHLHGFAVDIDAIQNIASRHNLRVVYDCAQSPLAVYRERDVSAYGDICAYSFFPGKNLGAYGDGGAVTTNSTDLAKILRQLSNHGRWSMEDKYTHSVLGYNSRLDTIQAAVLNIKLPFLRQWTHARQDLLRQYRALLSEVREVHFPSEQPDRLTACHLVVVRVPQRDQLLRYLHEQGIQAGAHYPVPLHLQPAMASLGYQSGDFPVSERLSAQVLSLPTFPGLTSHEILYITDHIKFFFKRAI